MATTNLLQGENAQKITHDTHYKSLVKTERWMSVAVTVAAVAGAVLFVAAAGFCPPIAHALHITAQNYVAFKAVGGILALGLLSETNNLFQREVLGKTLAERWGFALKGGSISRGTDIVHPFNKKFEVKVDSDAVRSLNDELRRLLPGEGEENVTGEKADRILSAIISAGRACQEEAQALNGKEAAKRGQVATALFELAETLQEKFEYRDNDEIFTQELLVGLTGPLQIITGTIRAVCRDPWTAFYAAGCLLRCVVAILVAHR